MIDNSFNEISAFSPFGGTLVLEEVKGKLGGRDEPENVIKTSGGTDRSMYVYVPTSGCPDAKQCQVMVVLRNEGDEASASAVLDKYSLRELAEEKHFILVLPNPMEDGWNYECDPDKDDDFDFLSRCFMTLPVGKGKVGGFIGMIFYVGLTPEASALILSLSSKNPLNVAAIMTGTLPEGYSIPEGVGAPQNAYVCSGEGKAAEYLAAVNAPYEVSERAHVKVYTNVDNTSICHMLSPNDISSEELRFAWDELFSESRRWANDTYGTYQRRTNFISRGFVAHVNDDSLGVNNGYAHTWYEYVPPQLRGSTEKVPLLFYFHGIGCVPLYGAEQSGWHDIADREGFIVCYPKPATNKMWNVWDEPILPSDHAFVLALIEHLTETYAIDESRIYITGFSMGGMMTHSLACAYPELFAAAAPCNGFNTGYLADIEGTVGSAVAKNVRVPVGNLRKEPKTRIKADEKKAKYDYRMPIIQNTGLLDGPWPATEGQSDFMNRIKTLEFWKKYNNIPLGDTPYGEGYESGLAADETSYDCNDERFLHHRWLSSDEGNPSLVEMVLAKRMPHALDLRQPELAWSFLKKFSRGSDGSLQITE